MNAGAEGRLRAEFRELSARPTLGEPVPWPSVLVKKHAIDEEIARLSGLSREKGERRASEIVHSASGAHPAFAPGLSISVNVLLPGEAITLPRDNAGRVELCISGDGQAQIGARTISMTNLDVWSSPSMVRRAYRCAGKAPFVWLSYSNAPLLDRLDIHYSDDVDAPPRTSSLGGDKYVRETAPDIPILGDGARLRGYEFLVDIEVVQNHALIWPWKDVREHLASEHGDGKRNIMLLYNPATGRFNGTTHNFFATMSWAPAGFPYPLPARGHKHSSFAANYHVHGRGYSRVDGELVEWSAGDLLLSAPSWSEHAHGKELDQDISIFTVQDHPFQIAIESLIWQESMTGPILTLGTEPGQAGYVGPRQVGD
jgi:gentisate 1,2-dioxygenase